MANQRADGKRLIGAQANPELWEGVDAWLAQHPRYNVTDFVLEALLEKLQKEGVQVDPALALRDQRSRQSPKNAALADGDKPSSNVAAAGARVLKKAAAANRRAVPK